MQPSKHSACRFSCLLLTRIPHVLLLFQVGLDVGGLLRLQQRRAVGTQTEGGKGARGGWTRWIWLVSLSLWADARYLRPVRERNPIMVIS